MANKRTPTKVLQMRGSGKAHPERMKQRQHEPVGENINPKAPAGFTTQEKRIWQEFIDGAPEGMLQESDRHILEVTVRLMARFRKNKGMMASSDTGQLVRGLSMLGKTPVDRSRVMAKGKGKGNDDWEDM